MIRLLRSLPNVLLHVLDNCLSGIRLAIHAFCNVTMVCLWWLLPVYLSLESALGQTDGIIFHFLHQSSICTKLAVCFLLAGSRSCSPPTVTKTRASSLRLSLSCPSDMFNLSACYIVDYSIMFRPTSSDNSNQKNFMMRNTSTTTFVLDQLFPFTTYEIKMKANYNTSDCNEYSVSSSPIVTGTTNATGCVREQTCF